MIRLSNILTEADDKNFTNPALNKKIKYTDNDGKQKENSVGNLLRLAKDNPGRVAAEKTLPAPGTPERKAVNQSLGKEKDGKTVATAQNTKKGGDAAKGGPGSGRRPAAEPEKPKPAAMYTADPAMAARMDTEKETQADLARDAAAEKDAQSSKKPDMIIPGKIPGTVIRKSDGKPDLVLPAPKSKSNEKPKASTPPEEKPKLNLPPPAKPKAKVPPPPPALPKPKVPTPPPALPKAKVPPPPPALPKSKSDDAPADSTKPWQNKDSKPKVPAPPPALPKPKVPAPPPALPKPKNANPSSDSDDDASLGKNIKTAVTKPEVYVRAIKDGIKDWAEEEKAFFKEKVHKGDSPERRSWGQALKDKAVGAYHALKKGFKHEVHTFKEAATGIAMWKDGIDMTEPQKKAVKSVAKKFAFGVVLGLVTGGLGAGAGAFAGKCLSGFIPHVIEETIIAGVGKAALFAGDTDADEEKTMEQFLSAIADNIEKMDMPPEIVAKAVEEYNAEKKEKGGEEITQNEARLAISQLQQLVKESIIR